MIFSRTSHNNLSVSDCINTSACTSRTPVIERLINILMKLAQLSPNRRKCNFKLRKSFEKLIHVAVELFGGTVWKFAESTQQVGGGEIVMMKSLNVVTLCLYKYLHVTLMLKAWMYAK